MANAPIRSLYRKILTVLNESQHGGASTLDQLVESLEAKAPLEFTYYSVNSHGEVYIKPCSKKRIRNVVNLCVGLNLLKSSSAELSKHGSRAIEAGKFDSELNKRLRDGLEHIGAPVATIDSAIREILLSASEDCLPTWQQVFERIPNCQDKDIFRTYIGLLSACGGISHTRKKILLPWKVRSK